MNPQQFDINLYVGADFAQTVTLTDSSGVAINLTGATFTGYIQPSVQDSTNYGSFTLALSATPVDGTFTFSMAKATVAAIPLDATGLDNFGAINYIYAVYMTLSGATTRLLQGNAFVHPLIG